MQRGVLGVHGDDARPRAFCECDDQLAPYDQRLLVREREVDALAERGDRGPEPRGADQPVEHEIGAGLDDELDEPGRAREHLPIGPGLGRAACHVLVGDRDPAHAVRAGLLHERLP